MRGYRNSGHQPIIIRQGKQIIKLYMEYQIRKDWIASFPSLYPYNDKLLIKFLDPFIIGLNLVKLPFADAYRPYFEIHPAWKKEVKECIKIREISYEFKNKKGFQFNIPYLDHNIFFNEAKTCAEEQQIFSFNGDVKFEHFIEGLDLYSKMPVAKSFGSRERCKVLRLKFYVALYLNDTLKMEEILNTMIAESREWDMVRVENYFGDFRVLMNSLYAMVNEREKFMNQIDENKRSKRVSKLLKSKIIM
jgi:hypothetical protein